MNTNSTLELHVYQGLYNVLRVINISNIISIQHIVARCSRERSCLVAFRGDRCDNGDATSDSINVLIRLGMGMGNGGGFGGAVVVSTVVRVGAVTFATSVMIML